MGHPEIAKFGLGAIDPERMRRAIGIVVEANALPRTPAVSEVFNADFLPSRNERASKL
jgi:NitT/TauT family transport system substrate-binding protein